MTLRFYANNAPALTLQSSITNSATSATVQGSLVGFPTNYPYFVTLERGTAGEEIISVTAAVGSVVTIVRAQNGSAAIAHTAGASFEHTVIAQDFTEANAHVNATTAVHGITGVVVGTTDAQTLTNKTLATVILTGTTSAVGITASGNVSVGGTLGVTGTTTLGTLGVSGAATLAAASATSLSVSGTSTLAAANATNVSASGTLTATGTTTLNGAVNATAAGTGLAVSHNATVGGTLTITGATTLTGGISLPAGGGGLAPCGAVFPYVGAAAPTGYLKCDGSAVSRTTFASLFAVIGTAYGAGDGSTTFNVPNIASGTFATGGTPGATGGAATHAHTLAAGFAEITIGTNSIVANRVSDSYTSSVNGSPTMSTGGGGAQTLATALGGTTDSNSNIPPFVSFTYIVKT